MIFFLYILTFGLLSLGQVGRISFFGQEINLYWYEIGILTLCLMLILKYQFRPLHYFFRKFFYIALFLGVLFFTFVIRIQMFSLFQNIVAFLYFVRLFLYFIFFIYFLFELNKNPKMITKVRYGFYIYIILTVLFSFGQYFLYPDLRNLSYLGWDPHLYRVFGTFFDTSIAGSIYGSSFFCILLEKKCRKINNFVCNILIGVLLMLTALTFSRSLYLVFIITLAGYLGYMKMWRVLIIFGAAFILLLFLVPKPFGEGVNLFRTSTLESRKVDQKMAVKLWVKKPFLGWGYNRIRFVKEKFNLINPLDLSETHAGASFHSSFLIILVSSGLIGLICFFILLTKLAFTDGNIALMTFFLLALSLFDNIILHPFVLFPFLIYVVYRFSLLFGKSR